MTLGYVGLRYIELSISSPICNSSGALVAVLCLLTGTLDESIQGAMRLAVVGAVMLLVLKLLALSPTLALRLPLVLIAAGAGAVAAGKTLPVDEGYELNAAVEGNLVDFD